MFDKIIGNERIKKTLRHLIKERRVPNAVLFAGEEGIGKKHFALELAKSFVCLNPKNGEACDNCRNCHRTDKIEIPKPDKKEEYERVFFTEHPDIGFVVPFKTRILVDSIRAIEKEANFRPFEATARFFIIDDADKMNDAAANALLKTLEEPPNSSYIFLITSRPAVLLPTILSRCQIVRFAPVAEKEIEKYLLETKQFSPDDAEIAAKLANGSLGRALEIDSEKFRVWRETMLDVLKSLTGRRNYSVLLQTAEKMNDAKNKDDYENYLDVLQTLIRDILIISIDENAAVVNSDIKAILQRIAENAERRKLAKWLEEIETLRENFNINLNRKIAADALFMEMAV
jgi:DNA polymerase III subunit delta'